MGGLSVHSVRDRIFSTRRSSWRRSREGLSGRIPGRAKAVWFAESAAIVTGIGYIFYNNMGAVLMLLWLIPVYMSVRRQGYIKKRKQELLEQFKEAMTAVSVSLSAGYSVENAFVEAEKEVRILYGDGADITKLLVRIRRQLNVNRNIEEVLGEFAAWSQIPDIIAFSEVFSYAKRSGGDMVSIIRDTVTSIGQRVDTAREISVLISAKQLEQYIMDVVPVAIILYLRISSPDLVGRLYGNIMGALVMTACLLVYGVAVILSIRIADIRV